MSDAASISPGSIAQLACTVEVLSHKAGNVHPEASFDDASCSDFLASAVAIRPVFDRAAELGVGRLVLEAVKATKLVTPGNTNLGMILLLAPLAVASIEGDLKQGVSRVLNQLTDLDAQHVYEAIRLAQPGGLGNVSEGDVAESPTVGLLEAMRLAADRDLIAKQYINGFADVFDQAAAWLHEAYHDHGMALDAAIVMAHLQVMAAEPDSLIARKCGLAAAVESMHRADAVLKAGYPVGLAGIKAFDAFDGWLRQSGHARNPGASADLICAGLYVLFWDGKLPQPWRWDSSLLPVAGDWLVR